VEGMLAVEMESCARLRPARDVSVVAMKPVGVRFVDSFAHSAARERSRRAFALRRFSSCALVLLSAIGDGGEGA
jgi:hypothetical protein